MNSTVPEGDAKKETTKEKTTEVKRYLGQYRYLLRKVKRLEQELEEWRSRAEKITPTLSDMPKGGGSQGLPATIEKIIEIEEAIEREIEEAQKLRMEIKKTISGVENKVQREVLECIYIKGMTLEATAEAMEYDVRHIKRLHATAIICLNVLLCHPEK